MKFIQNIGETHRIRLVEGRKWRRIRRHLALMGLGFVLVIVGGIALIAGIL